VEVPISQNFQIFYPSDSESDPNALVLGLVLVICLTGEYELNKALKIVKLDTTGNRKSLNWARITLGDLVKRAASEEGLCYEAEWDSEGKPTTILLVAIEPRSVSLLEEMFNLAT
jgi:hypothetical protein